jgi:RHS repeat-associated protein
MRVKSQTLGNGVLQTFNYYGWNAAVAGVGQGGGLQMQKYTIGTKTIYQASYSYDVLSNIKTLNTVQQLPDNTIRNDNYTYTYDAISRLTAASATSAVVVAGTPAPASNILNESYSYDGLGRMSVWNDTLTNVSKTYSYASQQPHAVKNVFYTQANAAQPGYQYGYDGAGNMQTKQTLTGTVAATQYTYSYDANGKLNQVKNNTGAIIAEFTYDAGGMRVLSKVNGVKTIRIGGIYEKEITGTGATAVTKVTKYYDGVALRVGSGTLQYLHRDHLGGVIAITNSSGAITRQERYKPFGETLWSAGTNIPTTQAYTGQKRESSFGLYDYNARWYDSALGRFTQADTIVPNPASAKAFDRYAYVYNNPINASDPSGHFGVCFQGGWYSQSNGGIDKNHPVTDVCKDLARSGAFGASGQYGVFTNDAAGIRSALAYFLKMIKELPNEITVVLGYSWGGGAAVEFSYALQKDSPTSRIDKMVLIDPVITWRDVTPERDCFSTHKHWSSGVGY